MASESRKRSYEAYREKIKYFRMVLPKKEDKVLYISKKQPYALISLDVWNERLKEKLPNLSEEK